MGAVDPNHDPSSPLGWDVDTSNGGGDMYPDGRACSGPLLVQSALRDRLMADTLPLTGAPGGVVAFGEDTRKWVGETILSPTAWAQQKQIRLTVVLQRDKRIDPSSLRVTVTPSVVSGALVNASVAITAQTTTAQPISVVFGISKASVAILAQGT